MNLEEYFGMSEAMKTLGNMQLIGNLPPECASAFVTHKGEFVFAVGEFSKGDLSDGFFLTVRQILALQEQGRLNLQGIKELLT